MLKSPWMRETICCAIVLAGCGRLGFAELDAVGRVPASTLTSSSMMLAVGAGHACVQLSGGDVYCWGSNAYGQLGTGAVEPYVERPGFVSSSFDAISAGKFHTCGLRGGELWCWGDNSEAQLGLGFRDDTAHTTPERVGRLATWSAVSAGRYHTCAIRVDETLWCWGYNSEGNLGLGDRAYRAEPTRVGGETGWLTIHTGGGYGGFARHRDGSTWAWGENSRGELGVGDTAIHDRPIETGHTWSDIGPGIFTTCALDDDQLLSCWGRNDHGQLGLGDHSDRHTPARVDDHLWIMVSTMESYFTCGIDLDAALYCWGTNAAGGLGVGDTMERAAPTHVVALGDGWQDVRGGGGGSEGFACGIHEGAVYCWGTNGDGQLGVGNLMSSTTPQLVAL
jgi:alpha-tubulin suppressor-like RCC1 family protein